MRLTLRTMLAYLDNILEPQDANELGDKIQESSFASDLVHRIRTSTRRLRLGAPKVTGEGMGLDPNTVAEYLDNTLPSDQVPDFEKVCLESDMHLAEVASCHQILTIVFKEPAEVDRGLRERMYRIGDQAGGHEVKQPASHVVPPPVPVSRDAGNGAASLPTPPDRPERPQPVAQPARVDVPAGVSFKSLAVTLLCTFVVVVVALRAVGPFDHTHVVYRLLMGSGGDREVAQRDSAEPGPLGADALPAEPVEPASAGEESSKTAAGEVAASPTAGPSGTAPEPSPANPANDARPAASGGEIPATVSPERSPTADPDPAAAAIENKAPEATAPEATVPESASAGGVPAGAAPAVVGAEASASDPAMPPTTPAGGTVDVTPVPVSPAPAVVEVGRYVAEDQLLARFERTSDDWYQVPTASVLRAGDRLISFPTYRPHVIIGDINVTFVNATSVELAPPGDEGQPRLTMHFGSAVMLPFKAAAGRIALRIGDQEGHVVFGDLDSVAAVMVTRYLPPGADPENTVAQNVFRLYAVSGRVGWSEPGAKTVVVESGQMLARVDGGPASVVDAGPLPAWIEGRDQKEIERRASLELRTALEKDRPLSRSLLEMTDFRQHEVVDLACRSLSYVGIYDPLIEALSEKRQHYYWREQFNEIRSIGARNRESAADLRRMIEKLHADDAATLYRLTWGYSPAQLDAGADAELVELLEHDAMGLRVMAFMNLERITGGVTKNFRPELPPSQERTKVANWRRALEEGTVAYKSPPSPWTPPVTGPPASAPKR